MFINIYNLTTYVHKFLALFRHLKYEQFQQPNIINKDIFSKKKKIKINNIVQRIG